MISKARPQWHSVPEARSMFPNREEAARQLADVLRPLTFRNPLILAIPNGGMVTGAVLAKELGMELDVILCQKLRSPATGRPVGAVSESGALAIDRSAGGIEVVTAESLIEERARRLAEISRRRSAFRKVRPPALVAGRSVLVTDDGLVTGATMTAALDGIRRSTLLELIVAVPIAPRSRLPAVRRRCDRIACVIESEAVRDLCDCYDDFPPVGEDEAARLLKESVLSLPGA
jgi:predicted phosphoribosyltransferase